MVQEGIIVPPSEEKAWEEHHYLCRELSLNETSMPWVMTNVRGKYGVQFESSLVQSR